MKKTCIFISFVVVVISLLILSTEGNAQPSVPLCPDINIIDSYPAPSEFSGASVHGIAFDGKSLWAAGYGASLIYKMGLDSNENMIVVDSIEAPSFNPTGMTFVGKNLFAGADDTLKISKIRTKGKKAGTVKSWFYAPGHPHEDCVGLTFAKGRLYNADFVWSKPGGAIHRIKTNGDLEVTHFFPDWDCPEGLAFDGEFIWLAELCQNKVYKLNLNDLTPVCYFDGPGGGPGGGPIGLTFDKKHLWLTDSATQTFYKIDISK